MTTKSEPYDHLSRYMVIFLIIAVFVGFYMMVENQRRLNTQNSSCFESGGLFVKSFGQNKPWKCIVNRDAARFVQ